MPVHFGSRRQSITADSPMAAEYIAAHEALKEALRVSLLLYLPSCDKPVLRTDNKPAATVCETGYSAKLVPYERAIGMRVGLYRDCILSGIAEERWIPGTMNAANGLTKRLGPLGTANACAQLGVVALPAPLAISALGRVDKLEWAAAALGVPAAVLAALLGLVRLAGAWAITTGRREITAEQVLAGVHAGALYVGYATADRLLLSAVLLAATLVKVEVDNAAARYYLKSDGFDLDALARRLGSGASGNIAKKTVASS